MDAPDQVADHFGINNHYFVYPLDDDLLGDPYSQEEMDEMLPAMQQQQRFEQGDAGQLHSDASAGTTGDPTSAASGQLHFGINQQVAQQPQAPFNTVPNNQLLPAPAAYPFSAAHAFQPQLPDLPSYPNYDLPPPGPSAVHGYMHPTETVMNQQRPSAAGHPPHLYHGPRTSVSPTAPPAPPAPPAPLSSKLPQQPSPALHHAAASAPPPAAAAAAAAQPASNGPMNRQVTIPPRPKPGRKPINHENATDRRRQQNRDAQRVFRDKRARAAQQAVEENAELKAQAYQREMAHQQVLAQQRMDYQLKLARMQQALDEARGSPPGGSPSSGTVHNGSPNPNPLKRKVSSPLARSGL